MKMLHRMTLYSNLLIFCILLLSPAHAMVLGLGNQESSTLTQEAWQALQREDYAKVKDITDRCIQLYNTEAAAMQEKLSVIPNSTIAGTYWALNDVGTCYFIQAQAFKNQGKIEDAKAIAQEAIELYGYSQCLDPQGGWFWSIADACNDLILTSKIDVDFGDYTSQSLTSKAWIALGEERFEEALIYTEKCIKLYSADADKMASRITTYAPKENAFDYWALNDVATCFFLTGEVYIAKQEWQKAADAFLACFEKYTYGQCWDPAGWFWKPGVVARGRYEMIQEQHLGRI